MGGERERERRRCYVDCGLWRAVALWRETEDRTNPGSREGPNGWTDSDSEEEEED